MPVKNDREYRNLVLEIRTPEEGEPEQREMIVEGYASTFNEPYTLYEDKDFRFQEVVDQNAFANTDMSDVIMQYNHEGRVFARTSNNTLSITPDEQGLFISANLGGTEAGRDLYEEIRGGYTNKMSFGFTVDGDEEVRTSEPDGFITITRRITSVQKLYDVSAVSIPANDATSISVRTLTDGVIEKVKAERLEKEQLELRRRKMELQIRLLGGHAND